MEDESVDCVISNCVINLLPQEEKLACFKEIFRILRPSGRIAISDILAKKELPEKLRRDMGLFVGCISGASLIGEYKDWLREAGLESTWFSFLLNTANGIDVLIVDKESDLNIYKERGGIQDPTCCAVVAENTKITTPSCCSSSKNSNSTGQKEGSNQISDIDFNEWVSK
jgi:arsenite methyltransferase